jgi:REP element-mobilizing transposase RayT
MKKAKRQLELGLVRGRGGPGRGQGRKKGKGGRVPHRRRPYLDGNSPMHVTMRILPGLPSLRGRKLWAAVRGAFVHGCDRARGFRIVHFSVQGQHLHLICEAKDRLAMTAGMKGFKNRVTRALNKRLGGRKGTVFTDRFDERILLTPTQCRHALAYVFNNQRHHAYDEHATYPPGCVDPCSSAIYFDGWTRPPTAWRGVPPTDTDDQHPVAKPQTWLLRGGWRRGGGPISPDHIPGLPRGAPALSVW